MNGIEKWFIRQLEKEFNNPGGWPNLILLPFAIYYRIKWELEEDLIK